MTKINFTYNTPEELVQLMCFSKRKDDDKEENYMWHQFLEGKNGATLFYQFMAQVLPSGGTIDICHIDKIIELANNYLNTNTECINERIRYQKRTYPYWVYSKYNNKLYKCDFTKHFETIARVIAEFYGKDYQDIDKDVVQKFVKNNFAIKSDNTNIDLIAKDINRLDLEVYNCLRGRKIF